MGWFAARNKLEVLDEIQGKKVLKKCNPPKFAEEHP
jgi:hypothetical protein